LVLQLFDTMTRQKAPFVPRLEGQVSMYVCGPTVYDHPHLGHGRTSLTYDVLRRYLRWSGYDVTMVSNVTDIDDNIINRANREGRTEPDVAGEFLGLYIEQMDRLDIERPDERPQATEFIDGMVEVITELLAAGAAYVVEGRGVYFSVESAPNYGRLAGRQLGQMLEDAGQRVEVDDEKRSPLDFVLWKAAKPGEPTWNTPWGDGRPGWHTECVAMSMSILGEGFDIHGGGDDLVFPHHQNEEAQVVACGKEFARTWVHSAMVNVSGEKMSKSLGNFTTLADALDAHDPRALRMAVLQTHYRSTMEVGPATLAASAEAVKRLDALVRRAAAEGTDASQPASETEVVRFRAAMDDDLGTPSAIDVVFGAVRAANTAFDEGRIADAGERVATVVELSGVLGIMLGTEQSPGDDDDEIDVLVEQRNSARADRDFALADQLRDELAERGIVIEDGAGGTSWHRA
jgi:cysteinyl-tRNA synthetase